MSVSIQLYKMSDPVNKVTKTLGTAKTVSGAFRPNETPSDRDPVIIIESAIDTLTEYNYAYIADFGAYYFIRERKAMSAATTLLTLHKDVLQTYDSSIRTHTAIISRQASSAVGDVDLDDSAYVVKRHTLETATLSNYGSHTASIVLGVTGKM